MVASRNASTLDDSLTCETADGSAPAWSGDLQSKNFNSFLRFSSLATGRSRSTDFSPQNTVVQLRATNHLHLNNKLFFPILISSQFSRMWLAVLCSARKLLFFFFCFDCRILSFFSATITQLRNAKQDFGRREKNCAEKRNLFCFPLSHVVIVVVPIFFMYFPLFTGFRRLGFLPWKFPRFSLAPALARKCSKLLFFFSVFASPQRERIYV